MKAVLIIEDTPMGVRINVTHHQSKKEVEENVDETAATVLCGIAAKAVESHLVSLGVEKYMSHLATNADGKFSIN